MSWRLQLLNLCLKAAVRPVLARMRTPDDARQHLKRSARRLRPFLPKMRVQHDLVQTPGGPMPVEWVAAPGAERHRIVLYLHGGAYLMGSAQTHRSITFGLASRCDARVMVPDYRLAPEHPAPAAVEDALAAYTSLLKQGYAAERIAFAGESAGGGLCFALLLKAQEMGFDLPGCVVAFSPWTDLTLSGKSLGRNAKTDVLLPRARFEEAAAYYIGGNDPRDPAISPLFGNFVSPPPAMIFASDGELLCDDSRRMAARLRDAGGAVELVEEHGLPHAWPFFAPLLPEASATLDRAATFIESHLAAKD